MTDWNPTLYSAFRGLRLRPALDLLAQVPDLPPGDVVDLGCGDGAVAGALKARFGRRLVGVDASPSMLEQAQGYDARTLADIAAWQPDTPPALIFSNAALQWLGDHVALMPRLAGLLAPGGTLAVQMPRNDFAPSHALLREVAGEMFPDRFPSAPYQPPVAGPEDYWHVLSPLGSVLVWESRYLQKLDPAPNAHPVRKFTESTAMRRVTDRLDAPEQAAFIAEYEARLTQAYPLLPDGGALFPFLRLFFTFTRPL